MDREEALKTLEKTDTPIPMTSEDNKNKETIAAAEEKHRLNLKEKAQLQEIMAILEQDENDLLALRKKVYELIIMRLAKK